MGGKNTTITITIMAFELDNKVLVANKWNDAVFHKPDTNLLYYRSMRPIVYSTATIDSMIDPQAYSGGHLPYGFCVTDGGNTYQVNNYSGTNEAPPHADWDNLGAGISFTPVSTPADLNAVRAVSTRTFGTGTRWAGEYTTAGLAGYYIQVADIDLKFDTQHPDGAYYNAGAGWVTIGGASTTFKGYFDGGGLCIKNLFHGTETDYGGLFGQTLGAIKFKNINLVNVDIACLRFGAPLVGNMNSTNGFLINNCTASGRVRSTQFNGGLVGVTAAVTDALGSANIKNCKSSTAVIGSLSLTGGLVGRLGQRVSVINCLSNGRVIGVSDVGGLVGSLNVGTVTASYYNSETSGQSDTGKGDPKTTAELLAGKPSAGIYTDWDERIWEFQAGKYPIHKFFGELAINLPAPTNLNAEENAGDIDLTWTAPDKQPKGYDAFVHIEYASTDWEAGTYSAGDIVKHNGIYYKANTETSEEPPHADWDKLEVGWNKINTELITDISHTYTPPEDGMYNFFVVAVYYNRVYKQDQSTGNSVTSIIEIV